MKNNNDAVQKLFTLGEIEHNASWIDYLKLGLSKDDLPQLLELLTDSTLLNAPVESKEVWVPQHIWRALGQLADESAIPELVTSFNTLIHDHNATDELPTVMAMIGVAAQQPLGDFLLNTHNSEVARIIAAQALQNIAEKIPASRALSVKYLTKQCALLDKTTSDLNTLVLCNMIDLKAAESIKEIQALCQHEMIDPFTVGDIEDIEIALGLRDERETERPDYGYVYSREHRDQLEPESTEEIEISLDEELEGYLLEYGNDQSIYNSSSLDGFFTAITCSPTTILPSKWMPTIWGGEKTTPAFPDQATTNLFTSAIMTFYNQVVRALRSHTYSALFLQREYQDETVLIVDEWCVGFMRGLTLWQPVAGDDLERLKQLLKPITLFGTAHHIDELKEMSPSDIETQQAAIEENIRQLFDYFVTQRRPSEIIVNETANAGRNDPCPCGSGKKFKKCCLH